MKGQKLGFVGLGIMGGSMAKNLLNGGFELYIYNRSSQKAEALIEAGAIWCESPAEVAANVDTVLICLTNGEAVESIIFGDDGLTQPGGELRRIVDHSTIAPEQARLFAETLDELGIAYIDAPVSGGDVGAREGTLTIMVGSEEADFASLKPMLSWMGRKIFHTGPVGNGQLTKCVNQLVVAGTVAAMTEGMMFAKNSGLSLEKTLEVLSGGAAGSWSISNYAPRILKGDLNPGFYARDMLKDLRIVLQEAESNNSILPVLGLVKELYQALCAGGDGELGNHALIRVYEKLGKKA